MTRSAKSVSLTICLWAVAVLFLPAPAPGAPPETGSRAAPLSMEELVVRGMQEKPDSVFVPVPAAIFTPAPVRFDLFLEDLAKPILPAEIPTLDTKGERLGDGPAPD